MNFIHEALWVNDNVIIEKIQEKKGEVSDLTKHFYCADNNLHDENYYENIGNCLELHKIFEGLR